MPILLALCLGVSWASEQKYRSLSFAGAIEQGLRKNFEQIDRQHERKSAGLKLARYEGELLAALAQSEFSDQP